MGSHQPDRVSVLQRLKGKRALVATAASGAVLAAGGVAGAAVVGGAQPQDLSSAAEVPAAQTSEQGAQEQQAPQADQEQVDKERDQAKEQREEAASQAEGAASATAAQAEEEKEEPAQPESSGGGSQQDSGSSQGLEPTGEGGACQASMYSDPQPTASGGTFDPSAMTAAHKSLPFGTQVEVTNPANGKSVVVSINDRGPYVAGRCLDLSTASFETIASASQGVVDVEWQVVG